MVKKVFSNLRGDLSGGLASAVMALPGNIIYGLIAFAPLGSQYAGQGILAGIYASVFAGLVASMLGGPCGMISGPRAPTVIVFASVVGQTLASGVLEGGRSLDVAVTIGFATVLFSGIFQLLFVIFRLDRLVKYLSFLVIAGVMNGTAVFIVYGALWGCLGVSRQPLGDLCANLSQIKPSAFLVALTSALLWAKGKKFIPWIPGPLLALLGGSGLYYGSFALGWGEYLGGTIAAVPGRFPSPAKGKAKPKRGSTGRKSPLFYIRQPSYRHAHGMFCHPSLQGLRHYLTLQNSETSLCGDRASQLVLLVLDPSFTI